MAAGAAACSSESTRFTQPLRVAARSHRLDPAAARAGSVQTRAAAAERQRSPRPCRRAACRAAGRGTAPRHPGQSPVRRPPDRCRPPPQCSTASLPPPVRDIPRRRAPIGQDRADATGRACRRARRDADPRSRATTTRRSPELARLNHIPPHTKLNIGDRATIPGPHWSRARIHQRVASLRQPKPIRHRDGQTDARAAARPKLQPQKPQQRAQTPTAPTENVATVKPAEVAPTPPALRAGTARRSSAGR